MEEKIILTDCDGCVLDWEFAFSQWMEMRGHQLCKKNQYYIDEAYGISSEEAHDLVRTFNESAAIGFLPPLRDSQEYISKLRSLYNYKFVCITSLSDDRYAKILRERNLAKLFGSNTFKNVICLPCGSDKDEALEIAAEKYPNAYWIEDKITNAETGERYGLKSRLVEHGHNMHYDGPIKVIRSWKEIYQEIVKAECRD